MFSFTIDEVSVVHLGLRVLGYMASGAFRLWVSGLSVCGFRGLRFESARCAARPEFGFQIRRLKREQGQCQAAGG